MSKVRGFTWTAEDVNLVSGDEIWGNVLVEVAKVDARIVVVTADLGNTTKLRRFKEAFPQRYFNVGVAEQNMMAVAAGLASTGLIPLVCTYATLATLRATEFLRTDIAYGQRNVKVIGLMAGVSFGQAGASHHSTEDLAICRAIPGLTVLAPCDGREMAAALRAALQHDGPVYLRTGRGTERNITDESKPFKIGAAHMLRPGQDLSVLACGSAVHEALRAAERARVLGLEVRVLNMSSLKPMDEATVLAAIRQTRGLITVEDHSVIGGLGTAVAEVVAASHKGTQLVKLGHQDCFLPMGMPEDLMHLGQFDEDAILSAICAMAEEVTPHDSVWQEVV